MGSNFKSGRRMEDYSEIDCSNGDEVRWVKKAEIGSVRVVDDEPCMLKSTFWKFKLAFASAPVAWPVIRPDANAWRILL